VFQHKIAIAPKHAEGPTKDRYKYLVFEQLMALSFAKMSPGSRPQGGSQLVVLPDEVLSE
jgi:hypothetical protein